jgi:hypothetical protein
MDLRNNPRVKIEVEPRQQPSSQIKKEGGFFCLKRLL